MKVMNLNQIPIPGSNVIGDNPGVLEICLFFGGLIICSIIYFSWRIKQNDKKGEEST